MSLSFCDAKRFVGARANIGWYGDIPATAVLADVAAAAAVVVAAAPILAILPAAPLLSPVVAYIVAVGLDWHFAVNTLAGRPPCPRRCCSWKDFLTCLPWFDIAFLHAWSQSFGCDGELVMAVARAGDAVIEKDGAGCLAVGSVEMASIEVRQGDWKRLVIVAAGVADEAVDDPTFADSGGDSHMMRAEELADSRSRNWRDVGDEKGLGGWRVACCF